MQLSRFRLTTVFAILLTASAAFADEPATRKWRATGEKPLEAVLVSVDDDDVVHLREPGGQETEIALDRLSSADKRYIKSHRPPVDKKAVGKTLKQGGILWHTKPQSAATAAEAENNARPIVWFRHVGEQSGPMCSAAHRMRSVSYADDQVQKLIRNEFVALSTNMEGLRGAGVSVGHMPGEEPGPCPTRFAEQNCQTLFLTPQLEIFHAATGFLPPEDLVKELEFAAKVFASIQDAKNPQEVVAKAQRERLLAGGYTKAEITPPDQSPVAKVKGFMPNLEKMDFTNMQGMFPNIARNRLLDDARYVIAHPLTSLKDFERDPSALIGDSKFAFVSVGKDAPSGRPTGR